uniref:Uncharacterized protein n=1 Tax=Utricularia reniformis TaxID=192314 RepID=A0A1Y0B4C0_9LAMI|nr:hypothetical protein AEK19_MT2019 [Utricularia reniformis]ART32179.1 hypothetical protein AEK19_MT2019 [Utricularia reniformis]
MALMHSSSLLRLRLQLFFGGAPLHSVFARRGFHYLLGEAFLDSSSFGLGKHQAIKGFY